MKKFLLPCSWPGRYLLAIGAGLLQAASFPNIGWWWLAWVSPGLVLLLGLDRPKPFSLGYCAGLGHYLLSLYWLLLIPLPVKAIAAWLAVSAILALYTALWTWFCCKIFSIKGFTIALAGQEKPSCEALPRVPAATWSQRAFWALICASAWVAMEMGIARIFTGFPWNLLGASQFKILPLIQIASVTGVYGVSFLIVWLSVSLASSALLFLRGTARLRSCLAEILLPAAALLAIVSFGFGQLSQTEPPGRELKIALVQPSIPQPVIWDEREKTNRFNKLLALSREALVMKPDLLVWPEAALPNFLTRFNLLTHEAVTNLVVPNKVWMILGANDARPKANSLDPLEMEFFNGSFLVAPTGDLVSKYYKRRLVMLGEYMPLARWLPFLRRLRSSGGGFTSGDGPVPFELSQPKAKISVLICFEDVFPHLVRKDVDQDTDFLLNLTNNGWFGEGAAQWQHAVSALFRAVENGLPLVRCANNGLTCWIDAHGRMHEVYFPDSRDIYQAGFKIAKIALRGGEQLRARTIYNHYGDCFGWGCVAVTFIALGWSWRNGRKHP